MRGTTKKLYKRNDLKETNEGTSDVFHQVVDVRHRTAELGAGRTEEFILTESRNSD